MKVYNFDINGFFLGEDDADESPLEPGVFLVPNLSTVKIPPKSAITQSLRYINNDWVLLDLVNKIKQVPIYITLRQVRLTLLEQGTLQQVSSSIITESDIIEWTFSTTLKKEDRLILLIMEILALSSMEIDDFFIIADRK